MEAPPACFSVRSGFLVIRRRLPVAGRLLPVLHVLLLLGMPLFHLSGLLLVVLLHLLLPRLIRLPSLFLLHALVIPLLLLHQLLVLLLLLGVELFLFLLILLIQLGVAGIRRSRTRVGLNVGGVYGRSGNVGAGGTAAGTRFIIRAIRAGRRGMIRASRLPGCDYSMLAERRGPGSCRDRRLATIHRGAKLRITTGRLHVLGLSGNRWKVPVARGNFILRCGAGCNATRATVIADPVDGGVFDDGGVIDIVNVGDIHIVDGAIVKEAFAFPTPAFVPFTGVAEAVRNSAVETNTRTPVAFVEEEAVFVPRPVSRRPEIAGLRSQHPGTGNPVVVVVVIVEGPVARNPDVALGRERGLFIDRQRGRSKADREFDLSGRYPGCDQHQERNHEQTGKVKGTHDFFLSSILRGVPVQLSSRGLRRGELRTAASRDFNSPGNIKRQSHGYVAREKAVEQDAFTTQGFAYS